MTNQLLIDSIKKQRTKLDRLNVQLTTGVVNHELIVLMKIIDEHANDTDLAHRVAIFLNKIPGFNARYDLEESLHELVA